MTAVTSGKRVAVMQPYFFPYGGYYRLFAAADEFIIFDCVQFPRRGRVHRTEVAGSDGGTEWLTLPLARQPRDALVRDLQFTGDARSQFDRRLARHEWIRTAAGPAADRVRSFLYGPMGSVVDFLHTGLQLVADVLGFGVSFTRSSALELDPSLRGQARVIAAAKSRGATRYLNAPGGRALYDAAAFGSAGIELSYLAPYEGRFFQCLPALMREDPEAIRRDVLATSVVVKA